MARPRKGVTPTDRFWKSVKKSDGCWLWTGLQGKSTDLIFYGKMKIGCKSVFVHRFSYEINCGPIPAGLKVCHTCDNGLCVRPDHLFTGTQKDNMQDCERKGRRKWRNTLTVEQVHEIRRIYKQWDRTFGAPALGRKYGVSSSAISQIITGKRWAKLAPVKTLAG